jgi:hypothetical protein
MSGLSFKKLNREATKKMKAQRKQQKRSERKQATADKDITEPGTTESISPLQTQEGALLAIKSPPPCAARG